MSSDEIARKIKDYQDYVNEYNRQQSNTWKAKALEKLKSIKESLSNLRDKTESNNIKRATEEMEKEVDEKINTIDSVNYEPNMMKEDISGEFEEKYVNGNEMSENVGSSQLKQKEVGEKTIQEVEDNSVIEKPTVNKKLMAAAEKMKGVKKESQDTNNDIKGRMVAQSANIPDQAVENLKRSASTKNTYVPDAVKLSGEEIQTEVEKGTYHPRYMLGHTVTTEKGTGYIQEVVKTGSDFRKVIVNYDDGTRAVEMIDIDHDIVDEPEAAGLYSFAVDFGYNGANTFIKSATPNELQSFSTINRYAKNAHEMYQAGIDKAEFADTFDNGVSFFMSENMAREFYRAGVMDRKDMAAVEMRKNVENANTKAKKMERASDEGEKTTVVKTGNNEFKSIDVKKEWNSFSKRQQNEITATQMISEATGVEIEFYRSVSKNGKFNAPNGFYDKKTDKIWLDVNAGKNSENIGQTAILKTASHELTHYIANWSKKEYKALEEFILDILEKETGKAREELIKNKMHQLALPEGEAKEEIIAEACEMMLKDSKAIEQLARKNKKLFDKIKEWIHKFIESIKKAFEGVKATSKESKAIIGYMSEVQKKWDKALVEAVKVFIMRGLSLITQITKEQQIPSWQNLLKEIKL